MTGYIPLHCHTVYSALDGSATPEDYMKRVKELGIPAISQTDHGTTSGWREFQRAAAAAGVKPILGIEAYHTDDMYDRRTALNRQDGTNVYNHLTILAKNTAGTRNINHMNKIAWKDGFYYKPRIGKDLVFENKEGIIVASGCMSGMLAKAVLAEDMPRAKAIAAEHKDALGDDYYIEVMATNPPALNQALLGIADELGISPVMTSDCHYANKDDLLVTEAMLILSTAPKRDFKATYEASRGINDLLDRLDFLYPERKMTFREIEIYLRSYEDEVTLFEKQGITRKDIFDNTFEIASKVEDYDYYEGLDLLPRPKLGNPQNTLRNLTYKGLAERGKDKDPVYIQRVEHELSVIFEKAYEVYFLIVRNMCTYAKQNDIRQGFGRGSGAGSLVNYCLGITEVDPIEHHLVFERFLDSGWTDPYKPKFERVSEVV